MIGAAGRTSLLAAFGLLAALASPPAEAAKSCWADRRSSDSAEIASLLSRYGHHADAKDEAGFVALFTDDGVWDLDATGRFAGSEAIRAFFSKLPGGSRHITSNYVIDVAADGTARARSYVTLMGLEAGRPVVRGAGTYEDVLVRIGCTWKIKSRKFTPWKAAL
jgi:hypothetical protein